MVVLDNMVLAHPCIIIDSRQVYYDVMCMLCNLYHAFSNFRGSV